MSCRKMEREAVGMWFNHNFRLVLDPNLDVMARMHDYVRDLGWEILRNYSPHTNLSIMVANRLPVARKECFSRR